MKVHEVLQYDTTRHNANPTTVAVKDSKNDAQKIAEDLERRTPNTYKVREREV